MKRLPAPAVVAIVAAVTFALFAAGYYGYRLLFPLPQQPGDGGSTVEETSDGEDLEAVVKKPDPIPTREFVAKVEPEDVRTVVADIPSPQSGLYWEAVIEQSQSGQSLLSKNCTWKKGSLVRTDIYGSNGKLKKRVVYDGQSYSIKTFDTGKTIEGIEGEGLSAESLAGAADLNFFLSLDSTVITSAGIEKLGNEKTLFIEYVDQDFGYTHRYWISLDYGLPLEVEVLDKSGETIYRLSTSSLAETDIGDDHFRL